ncbi:MAG: hypothetical protein JO225_08490 [Candidatus Eremiobacteraeota bacterium]|nr:hypothetical protein [Candidatus Eremiobacteraeota bacterium]MBV8643939.1 hypothetical protein [Candidatus Eremiobacteraeota bacterium]
MSVKPPLAATIAGLTLTIGSKPYTPPPFVLPKPYDGHPWYCHSQSNGTTLTILIDENPGIDPSVAPQLPPATAADVTIAESGAVLQNFAFPSVAYHGDPVYLVMQVDSTLTSAAFFIDDRILSTTEPPTSAKLKFILVQESALGPYRIAWLQPDSFISIENAATLGGASVVLPAPSSVAGSVLGPMGFSTP